MPIPRKATSPGTRSRPASRDAPSAVANSAPATRIMVPASTGRKDLSRAAARLDGRGSLPCCGRGAEVQLQGLSLELHPRSARKAGSAPSAGTEAREHGLRAAEVLGHYLP